LSDKDFIKDLFQEQLGNLESPVDPDLWTGIQSQIGQAATSTGVVAGKVSMIAKIAIAASVVSAAAIGGYFLSKEEAQEISKEASSDPFIPEKSNDPSDIESFTVQQEENSTTPIAVLPPPNTPIIDDHQFDTVDGDIHSHDSTGGNGSSESLINHSSAGNHGGTNTADSAGSSTEENPSSIPTPELEATIISNRRDNQHYQFRAESNDASVQFIWDFGDGNQSNRAVVDHFYTEAGMYQVSLTAMEGNRAKTVFLSVEVKIEGKITHLPDYFTPNNDGANDFFFIESEGIEELTIVIMNRNNEIVFESNDIEFRWDGRDRRTGIPVEKGTYYYMISAKDKGGNLISKHNQLGIDY
jgi:gliding motility-associated-like protein